MEWKKNIWIQIKQVKLWPTSILPCQEKDYTILIKIKTPLTSYVMVEIISNEFFLQKKTKIKLLNKIVF